ncbi:MAG: substrate-binding domain-containing protein [Actinomycetota bacterium]|nr:substrate-binding domain-containing protein [Actinomycetota bacterium]
MISVFANKRAPVIALLALACTGLAAGCSSSSSSSASTSSTPATSSGSSAPAASGSVSIAYASSLAYLNAHVTDPAFKTAAGYSFTGRAGASGTLETDIASGEITPNVFESVGGDNITPLEPKYTSWYIPYAGTSMVLAYNPKSKYASQFKAFADGSKPLSGLFSLLETPGLKLGRTDPNIDPQGRDFIYTLELAQAYYHLPSDTVTKILGGPLASAKSSEIYDEATLPATLQSGQLDASSAFVTQAIELHLDYIPLPAAINLSSGGSATADAKATIKLNNGKTKSGSPQVIDITIIGTPTPAAIAFVKYTLSPAGLAQYKAGGFTLIPPAVTGSASSVPSAISSELGG